tara:strand:- start:130 stop:720 length:591 start_codon:yes stop_codon:yes gene_type:complete
MNRLVTLIGIAVVVGGAAVFSNAEEEARKSEIATFESVQQDKDYRVSLLGVTKGIAFVDSQELIGDGGRPPGKNAVPWMRVVAVIEKLTDKDETWGFSAETADGNELVGKVRIEWNGRVVGSRINGGIAEFDCAYPGLRETTFPVGLPKGLSDKKSKVHVFTLSGKFQPSETVVLRFFFGDANDRRELVFNDVPLP